jgi:hypothetical protein
MDPDLRTALLAGGLVFCALFGLMTVVVAIEYGIDVFTFAAVAILTMLMLALIGAIRNPPD